MPPRRSAGTGAEAELPEYAGQYRLESCLGSGGMGVVHLARSTSGLRLAVKVVHAEFAKDPEFRGRFRQEIAAARRVSGAFTAPVVDADPEADRPWMATLFIPGLTLAEHVKRNGSLSSAQLRQVMAGLAEALRDIHRAGVVHRDLKPSNVLLAEDGPKVIDFGISRPSDSELRTETGKLIGTPPFMAPEQFRRPREVGPAADIFALGSVLVHAATGRGPFDSDSPYIVAYQVVHDEPDLTGVPDDLAPLIVRCLAKEPDERPTPDELMGELRLVSSLYDTQAFIPAQRTPEPEAEKGSGTEAGTEAELEAEAGAEGVSGLVPGPGHESLTGDGATHVRGPGGGDVVAGSSEPSGLASSVGSRGLSDSSSGPSSRTRRRRRRVLFFGGAGVVAVLAVGGALVFGVPEVGGDSGGRSDPGTGRRAVADTFRPWVTKVGTAQAGMSKCAYGGGALRCAAPGVLAASIDPLDGKVRWTRKAEGAGDGTTVAPVLSGGLVHVVTPDRAQLVALDPDTGRTRWTLDLSAYNGSVQHAGDTVLLTSPDGMVTGVDGKTGDRLWRERVAGAAQPPFAYFGGELAYATTLGADNVSTQVIAVDLRTGDIRWRHRLDGVLSPVGVEEGTLWLTEENSYQETVSVVGYTSGTGDVRRIPLALRLPSTTAALHDGTVSLLATGGALVAVDVEAGKQRWRLETSVSRGSEPTADGRTLYVTAPDGRLLAVDARTGRLLGQTRPRLSNGGTAGVVAEVPAPLVVGDRVYGSAPDGSVFAVDAGKPADW
ncbi:serine/threonine-protein kinase [Streptomyces sp. NBC_00878]|uniref:serine/threonine-protein kinase n=1 Tax=Streptomyces sp. NBC_00878 TaxID=2975854 RepID=UPI0022572690|nr:serine/threonine-protein kinase [Streptomyces sp. NBC_00878]MCX4907826.1 serine/threonine-protein kinase [Streptomyces sp. NBC_00878]